jgi:hypothetical protein
MSKIRFGTVVEMKQMSVNERLERKKYMGVWRCESQVITSMTSRFPRTVSRYIHKNSPKRTGCSSGSFESPRR